MFFRPAIILNAASRAAAAGTTRRAVVNASGALAAPTIFSRLYSSGLSPETIETRVLDIVKGFDKVDGSKVTKEASFVNDLGLDSLDAVEVVMAIEEDFSVEIPDKDADEIKTVQQAIDYIKSRDDAQ
ncbi:acyl carrier protein-like protein [Syncephalastrum racemosum]|uniref:Acyl carrier protein n=1 Tax=Syncephalastrum racemosum TaxID=13706 RepID=A0A1X2GYY5_SYNRA|nr:acyl carrier protein-like protein [Syncephalastrum racemosum]